MFFQKRFYIRNIDLIITKLENDLDIGQLHIAVKFDEDIPPIMMKTRSFDCAMFLMAAELTEI